MMRNLALGAVIGFALAAIGLSVLSRDPDSAAAVNAPAPPSAVAAAGGHPDLAAAPTLLRMAPAFRQQMVMQAKNRRLDLLTHEVAGPAPDAGAQNLGP